MADLKNSYWVLRHAQSQANVSNLIISSPENGLSKYGLSRAGKKALRLSLRRNKEELESRNFIIFCSDFLRTLQTAEMVSRVLKTEKPQQITALRERFFGQWESKDHKHYNDVWEWDCKDSSHTRWGVESVEHVRDRIWNFILNDIETRYSGQNILLISHGDPLQIIQTHIQGEPLNTHREREPLNTGDFRLIYSSEE